MNTTTAAEQHGVTAATIRRWCRTGRITATKTAGRWIIETPATTEETTVDTDRYEITTTTMFGATYYRARDLETGASAYKPTAAEAIAAIQEFTPAPATAATPARRSARRDFATDVMAASFGLRSSARPGDCHYCGLDARTCDCR